MKTQVLIAGGGPVGMTLALELARYNIESILVERNQTTTRHPKMDLTNGRSMELFRRLGINNRLRSAGVPADNPFDVSWITSLTGHELHRFHYPSSNQFAESIKLNNDGSQPREAPLRVSQIDIEPVLKTAIDDNPLINVHFGTRLDTIIENGEKCVIAEIVNEDTGEKARVECDFLAGCDGGGSRVRRNLGIELEGELNAASAYMVHFHSTAIDILQKWGITWHYQNGAGTLIAQNDCDTWTLQAWLPPGDDGTSWVAEQVLENWVGCSFNYEILQANPWSAHFVVAEKYWQGRVLLAGDSAHQYIPTGGYGMNSGIADSIALAWVLAGSIQGWGGPDLLPAYDKERRPTAWWHLNAARRHMAVRIQIGELYQEYGELEGDDPASAEKRIRLAEQIATIGNAENESWGIEMGYRYDQSPIICHEENTPEMDPLVYKPFTYPGFRCPHLFLSDGDSIHDKLGLYFTLLVFGEKNQTSDISSQVPEGFPLKVVLIRDEDVRGVFEENYLLVRPDQHIAWRGDSIPRNFNDILKKVSGN